jgi:hypothetical protein
MKTVLIFGRYRAILFVALALVHNFGFAHDTDLHSKMSEAAFISSANLSGFFEDNLAPDAQFFMKFTYASKSKRAIQWLSEGSIDEDHGDFRVRFHFYVPVPRSRTGDRKLTDGLTGINDDSFRWASGNAAGNSESWRKARDYEYDGIISESSSERSASLGHMFKALGHVIHLNQDLSQPSHARNDNHIHVPGTQIGDPSKIEKYGLGTYFKEAAKLGASGITAAFPFSTVTWEEWRAAGFDSLEAFWDRKKYNGQREALLADEANAFPSTDSLGLAEYTSGNFLSDDALYTEVRNLKPQHIFPFPAMFSGTDYRTAVRFPAAAAKPVFLNKDLQKKRVYIQKTGDGTQMKFHSAVSYLGVKKKDPTYAVGINDNNVLQEYLSILIPTAIQYSTGILDYFFRGKLETTMVPNSSGGYNLTIKNVSGQDFHGGEFQLYWDDASGNRTRLLNPGSSTDGNFIPGWSGTLTILNNGTASATFKPPTSAVRSYTLVYKGTIGAASGPGTEHDPVDDGIAIAAKTFYPFLYWTMDDPSGDRIDSSQGIHLVPETDDGGVISSVAGKISNATELYGPDHMSWTELDTFPTGLRYAGNGVTLTGWLRANEPHEGTTFALTLFGGSFTLGGIAVDLDGYYDLFSSTGETPISFSPDVWHFFVLEFNASSAQLSVQCDGGDVHSLAAAPPTESIVRLYSYCAGSSSAEFTCAFDEFGLFPFVLTSAQKAFLYNDGAGRPFPFTLP